MPRRSNFANSFAKLRKKNEKNSEVTDFPLFGIEIIGAGADIIDKAEWKVLIGYRLSVSPYPAA